MIQVIISITQTNTEQELLKSIYSIPLNAQIMIISSIQELTSLENYNVIYTNNELHIQNFLIGIKNCDTNDIITFIKAGDSFIIKDLFLIENIFYQYPKLTCLRSEIMPVLNYNLYTNEWFTLQGWFFKKDFISFYSKNNYENNEIDFILNLAYYANINAEQTITISLQTVMTTILPVNIHTTFIKYMQENDINQILCDHILTSILCDCYITYIQALNSNEETLIQSIYMEIQPICQFILSNFIFNSSLLLNKYNQIMKQLYNDYIYNNIFLQKLPSITFIDFLKMCDNEKENNIC